MIEAAEIHHLRSVARAKLRHGKEEKLQMNNIIDRISDYRNAWWEYAGSTEENLKTTENFRIDGIPYGI
jgi:hypothetical protein